MENKKGNGLATFGRVTGKLLLFLVEVAVLAVIGIYCAGTLVAKGPSPYASGLLAGFFAETGVFKKDQSFRFVANLFYTEEELAVYEQPAQPEALPPEAVEILPYEKPADPTQPGQTPPQGPQPDAWGLVDEDGDGIIVEQVKGPGYRGYMMVVLDPSRVIMGSHPDQFGGRGYTVEGMAQSFGAVAGVNAGGFEDENGTGNGSIPNSLVIFEGQQYFPAKGTANGFAGFDSNHKLIVGNYSAAALSKMDIQYGASFGPVLIQDGVVNTAGMKNSAVNPRTAIGQRSDGAVLLLVIDGRQPSSIGATYQDLADVFLNFGAVNACNMDGGSSSLMWFEGEYLNNSASLVGVRPVPSTFLVLAEGGSND